MELIHNHSCFWSSYRISSTQSIPVLSFLSITSKFQLFCYSNESHCAIAVEGIRMIKIKLSCLQSKNNNQLFMKLFPSFNLENNCLLNIILYNSIWYSHIQTFSFHCPLLISSRYVYTVGIDIIPIFCFFVVFQTFGMNWAWAWQNKHKTE